MNTKTNSQKIKDLQNEIKQLKKLGKVNREPKKGLGGIIQKLREEKGMNMNDLAAKAICSNSSLSRIERSDNPNIGFQNLARIAKALRVSLTEMMVRLEEDDSKC